MEKINIAELLKDCPKGMELDCVMFDNVTFGGISNGRTIVVIRRTVNHKLYLDKYGCPLEHFKGDLKCVIFPKGKTTWEGFVPPCKFKDGDVITCTNSACSFVAIFKETNTDTTFRRYVSLTLDDEQQFCTKKRWADLKNPRFATEEEKQKLFDAIKAKGYKWNAETKTLERLIEPKFKVGDRIKHIVGREEYATIKSVEKLHYNLDSKVGTSSFSITLQDEWELAPSKFDINTLKPFESRVLVRDKEGDSWRPAIFGCNFKNDEYPFFTMSGWYYKQCTPYEENKHLLGTTDDCDEYYKTWEE